MTGGHAIAACWIVFFATWLVLAANTKRNLERQSTASRLHHNLLLWIAAFLLFYDARHGTVVYRLRETGIAITAVGVALAIWARLALGRNWSGVVTFKEGHELIVTGPYRVVRNPIYTGLLLMFLGTALYQDRWLALAAVPLATVSLWIKLRQEEEVLQRHFPDTFPIYRRRVKALLPFIL